MIAKIKQAIVNKLIELYPSANVHDETIPQDFKGGSFFITVIESSYKKMIGSRNKGVVMFDLAYYPTSDIYNQNNECHEVVMNIFREFELNGFRIQDKSSSITDDVLHMQFTVNYREIKLSDEIVMNDIKLEKGGN